MLLLGPAWGLLANVLIYLPLTILLIRLPYTGHSRLSTERRAASFKSRSQHVHLREGTG